MKKNIKYFRNKVIRKRIDKLLFEEHRAIANHKTNTKFDEGSGLEKFRKNISKQIKEIDADFHKLVYPYGYEK